MSSLIRRFGEENTAAPKKHNSGSQSPIQEEHRSFPEDLLKEKNDITLSETAARFNGRFGRNVGVSAVRRALKRLNITRKKTERILRKKQPDTS